MCSGFIEKTDGLSTSFLSGFFLEVNLGLLRQPAHFLSDFLLYYLANVVNSRASTSATR
jgi:hypothetical protein